ncbi:hypothetical protein [Roseicitreum antarcticum]|uniref:Uncharacterized protein n=1 Tax=Roseicitreum antarcticum TaxID=564137 RepID=A0A1H3FXN4_9RHOB|nr:hypothetical protein [Roseicitreum antarcticum]SDX95832.1 hypothetical protein SAMN04488238_1536 [Roseicitreum antarcticum]
MEAALGLVLGTIFLAVLAVPFRLAEHNPRAADTFVTLYTLVANSIFLGLFFFWLGFDSGANAELAIFKEQNPDALTPAIASSAPFSGWIVGASCVASIAFPLAWLLYSIFFLPHLNKDQNNNRRDD